jgi:hypothetical protein
MRRLSILAAAAALLLLVAAPAALSPQTRRSDVTAF